MKSILKTLALATLLTACGTDNDSTVSTYTDEQTVNAIYEDGVVRSEGLTMGEGFCTFTLPAEFKYRMDGSELLAAGFTFEKDNTRLTAGLQTIEGRWNSVPVKGQRKAVSLTFQEETITVKLWCAL